MTMENSYLTFHIKIVLEWSEKPKIWISTMENQVILLHVFFLFFGIAYVSSFLVKQIFPRGFETRNSCKTAERISMCSSQVIE